MIQQKAPRRSPETALWRAVILQALLDCVSHSCCGDTYRSTLLIVIVSGGTAFTNIPIYADACATRMRRSGMWGRQVGVAFGVHVFVFVLFLLLLLLFLHVHLPPSPPPQQLHDCMYENMENKAGSCSGEWAA